MRQPQPERPAPRPRFNLAGWILAACLVLPIVTAQAPALAQEREAMLMEGKKTLHQRVLTRPGARLRADASSSAAFKGEAQQPFTIFFVYGRKSIPAPGSGSQDWVEVGTSARGTPVGWLSANEVVDWKQTLILAFKNPANRDRVLFFKDREKLMNVAESESVVRETRKLREAAKTGKIDANSPVVAIEPATHIDIRKQFYMLPILSAEETMLATGFQTQLLEIASINQDDKPAKSGDAQAELLKNFKAGIVFVVDTSISMSPYIERTRQAIRKAYDRIAGSPVKDRFSFGLIAFRNSTKVTPRLEYVTRVYGTLEDGREPARFLQSISQVDEAKASSRGFDEDAFAGVKAAIDQAKWEGYHGRYVVLISDAGGLRGNNPQGETGMDAAEIRQLAAKDNIAIYVLHLLTPEGKFNHRSATGQYAELSYWPDVGSLYFGVPDGSVNAFGEAVDRLADNILQQVTDAISGKLAVGTGAPPPAAGKDKEKEPGKALTEKASLVGRAMQLAYLGQQQGTQAPPFYRAWTTDVDLENSDIKPLDVRVLLTKTQLSDLQTTLKAILDAGQKARLSPRNFFDQLRSAAAVLGRDPSRVGKGAVRNLAEVGLFGEYLDDLPYKSALMGLTADEWLSMGPGRQREFLDTLESRVRLYQEFHDDTKLWVALDGGKVPGDAVYPVPLDSLP